MPAIPPSLRAWPVLLSLVSWARMATATYRRVSNSRSLNDKQMFFPIVTLRNLYCATLFIVNKLSIVDVGKTLCGISGITHSRLCSSRQLYTFEW